MKTIEIFLSGVLTVKTSCWHFSSFIIIQSRTSIFNLESRRYNNSLGIHCQFNLGAKEQLPFLIYS